MISEIVNKNMHDLRMIVLATGVGEATIHHIFEQIERGGRGKVLWHSGGATIMPEPTLKRLLDE